MIYFIPLNPKWSNISATITTDKHKNRYFKSIKELINPKALIKFVLIELKFTAKVFIGKSLNSVGSIPIKVFWTNHIMTDSNASMIDILFEKMSYINSGPEKHCDRC